MGDGRDENPVIGFTSDLIIDGGRYRQVLDSVQYLIYVRELFGIHDLAVGRANLEQVSRATWPAPSSYSLGVDP